MFGGRGTSLQAEFAQRAGLIHHTPANIATTTTPGITASHVPVTAACAGAGPADRGQRLGEGGDARRGLAAPEQAALGLGAEPNWIAVAEPAATATPTSATSAAKGATAASKSDQGSENDATPTEHRLGLGAQHSCSAPARLR